MCSINGYVRKSGRDEHAFNKFTRDLTFLEYRGYDSKGLAAIVAPYDDNHNKIYYLKSMDKVNDIGSLFKNEYYPFNIYVRTGIGHNRWATHGEPTINNAHPHSDCNEEIAVVHNGIIENYLELYEKYPGHIIRSETDSEIIPHLIEEHMKRGLDFENAFKLAEAELEGTYAIAAINVKEPDIIMTARQDSPLIIGFGDNINYVSSDIISLLGNTDRFIRLKNGDTAKITKDSVEINNNGEIVEREIKKIDKIPQGWFEHTNMDLVDEKGKVQRNITLFEVRQQTGIDKSGRNTMRSALNQDKDNISRIIETLKSAEKIILTGSGSSYNAAIGGEFLFSELGYNAHAIPACNLELYKRVIDQNTAVLTLSQSGETMDIIQPLKRIKKENNPDIISMVNVPFSTISEEIADLNIPLNCGAERAVAATKSFTSQQILLRYLSYGLDGRLDEGEKIIRECIDKISKYSYMFRHVEGFSSGLVNADNIIVLGEGIHYSVARETALKIEELTRIPAKAYESGEFKHGPLTMVGDRGDQYDRNTIIVAISPQDNTYQSIQNTINEIRSHGGNVFELTNADDKKADDIMNTSIGHKRGDYLKIPTLPFYENAEIIKFQLSAIDAANSMNIYSTRPLLEKIKGPWDTPKNLAKTLTTR